MKVGGYKECWKKLLHMLHDFSFLLWALLSMLNRNLVMCMLVVVSLCDMICDYISFLSHQIHRELHDQNVMLGNLDEDFEDAMHGMDLITKKTKELIRKSGGCKTFSLIVCLSFILLFLFILVICT